MVCGNCPTLCFTAYLCSAEEGESCPWVTQSDPLPDVGFQFDLSHTLSPYAEENTMLEVTVEAIDNFTFFRKTKRFYLRDISKWNWSTSKTFNWRLSRWNKQAAAQVHETIPVCHFSSIQFSPTVPRLSSIMWWSRTWMWLLRHHPAGLPLTASSVWNTSLNMSWRTMARYTRACTQTAPCLSLYPLHLLFLLTDLWDVTG